MYVLHTYMYVLHTCMYVLHTHVCFTHACMFYTHVCFTHIHVCLHAAKSLQPCPTLCDPIDGSPPGSPIPGILQARTLEWVAIPFSNA